jgi:hypothetical protein
VNDTNGTSSSARHIVGAVACLFFLGTASNRAGDAPTLLKTMGWGGLSGKVIDAKTKKPVPDAVVFLKAPRGTYFPIHEDDRKRSDLAVQIPPGGTFDFRMLVHYPNYFDGVKKVPTGQKFVVKGDPQQDHQFTFFANKKSFGNIVKAGSNVEVSLEPSALPATMQSDIYATMKAHVYVFNHPYHAITGKDGTYTIPRVPAGAEVCVMGWHEEVGWLLTKTGKTKAFQAGKNSFAIEMDK